MDREKQARAQIRQFFADFDSFVPSIHDSIGLVNLEISRFSVDKDNDNDNNDRRIDRLLYPLCMRGVTKHYLYISPRHMSDNKAFGKCSMLIELTLFVLCPANG